MRTQTDANVTTTATEGAQTMPRYETLNERMQRLNRRTSTDGYTDASTVRVWDGERGAPSWLNNHGALIVAWTHVTDGETDGEYCGVCARGGHVAFGEPDADEWTPVLATDASADAVPCCDECGALLTAYSLTADGMSYTHEMLAAIDADIPRAVHGLALAAWSLYSLANDAAYTDGEPTAYATAAELSHERAAFGVARLTLTDAYRAVTGETGQIPAWLAVHGTDTAALASVVRRVHLRREYAAILADHASYSADTDS